MITFVHRDRRRILVGEAITAANMRVDELDAELNALPADADPNDRTALEQKIADLKALLTLLNSERTELAKDVWQVSDESGRALATDWLWATTANLYTAVKNDPPLQALDRRPLLTPATAAVIEALPRAPGDPRPGFLDGVATAVNDSDSMNQLIGFALGRWLRLPQIDRRYPFRDVGVMLPLRLETLFDQQPDNKWKLSLRVIPDEPSIRRDQPKISQTELECLEDFWNLSRAMAPVAGTTADKWLEHPDGIVAWTQLCDRVGPARAALLVSTFLPELEDGAFTITVPADRIGNPIPARVTGLPQLLNVVAIDTNRTHHQIGTLKPDEAALTLPLPATPDNAFDSWLISWTRAKAVGMGDEFTLPDGCTPDTIDALYVYGIGDEQPTTQFAAHVEAGVIGLLRLGAPTNTIHGMPAADLAKDAETWRTVAGKRLRAERDAGWEDVAKSLCGDKVSLPFVPGGSNDFNEARRLVQALWPAVWGHYFHDLTDCADEAHQIGLWAMEHLHPEGPLLPIRIGTQPYGLLPVSSIERWRSDGITDFDQTETRIIEVLKQLSPAWVSAGAKQGTVVGADAQRLLELLARPGVSPRYFYRLFLPAELLAQAYPAQPQANFLAGAHQLWLSAINALGRELTRTHLTVGGANELRLPLIGATRLMPRELTLEEAFLSLYREETINVFRGIVPNSLLVRLLIHSVTLAKAWYVQSAQNIGGPLLNPLRWEDPIEKTPLEQLQANFVNAEQNGLGQGPVVNLLHLHQRAVFDVVGELDQYRRRGRDPLNILPDVNRLVVPPERLSQLERALRATLDTAGHRIDPWATGIAWRRLRQHAASVRGLHRLGAYSWLDGPFRGTPGPNRSGRLHAPSHTQALTSIILRDKFLSSDNEPRVGGRNIWEMSLTSTTVRLAVEMAEEVRMGLHIFEVVGRRVEGIIGLRDRVMTLRKAVPLRPEKPDRRDVCHGLNALDGLLATNPIPNVLIAEESERQLRELNELKGALEAYSDLLVAEGVHQVVTGHPDIAAEVMDAAAGFARPPSLEFVRTPPSGYRLPTSVMTVLSYRRPVVSGSPLTLVDASLAAFLEDRFGDANRWSWRVEWTEELDGVSLEREVFVTLPQMSLNVLDVVLVPEDFLVDAVRAIVGVPTAKVTPPPYHRLIRQLAGTLGSRPAALSDIVLQSDLSSETLQQAEDALRLELFGRYEKAHNACSGFAAEMDVAGLSVAERINWLRRALAWGLVGPADPQARKSLLDALFGIEPVTPNDLLTLTQSAKATLTTRLKALPDITDAATAQLSPIELARALAEIASPDGKLTITARFSTASLLDSTSLQVDATEADLDDSWLTVVAAVRPALSRLEAVQLEARVLKRFEPLSAWTNSPGDPWQKGLVGRNVNTRRGATGITKLNMQRFVAGYGPANVWQGADVAVALVDQFSESVPMAERSTYAAFGFNAPAARAPQAILLAVPPRSDQRLELDNLLEILKETRKLVRTRAAGDVIDQTLAPTMWFQGLGPMRMRLDTSTQYWR